MLPHVRSRDLVWIVKDFFQQKLHIYDKIRSIFVDYIWYRWVRDSIIWKLWHMLFTEFSFLILQMMQFDKLVHDMCGLIEVFQNCESLMMGKQHLKSLPYEANKCPLELITSN